MVLGPPAARMRLALRGAGASRASGAAAAAAARTPNAAQVLIDFTKYLADTGADIRMIQRLSEVRSTLAPVTPSRTPTRTPRH